MNTMKLTTFVFILIGTYALVAVEIGDTLPAFKALDDSGHVWQSSDYLGTHYLVIYFYPAAMTGGCTKQACAYRDHNATFDSLKTKIVGISGDEVKNLQWFKLTHLLNFTLLSDADAEIAALFGVPTQKGGVIEREVGGEMKTLNRNVTTARWTFVLDKQGNVIYKQEGVNPLEDSGNVLVLLRSLKKQSDEKIRDSGAPRIHPHHPGAAAKP